MLRFCIIFLILQSVLGIDPGYYKKIWNENVAKAKKWKRPTYSQEFAGFDPEALDAGSFDFIIIGAGIGGSVLANRLSENPKWTVLVLEAGELENDFIRIPAATPYVQASSANWGYLTTPQANACFGRVNKQCAIQTGKIVGGSSSIGDLEYTRGNKADLDSWADLGLKSWAYKNVLRYFKKLETVTDIVTDFDFRGFKGPQNVTYSEPPELLVGPIEEANIEMGFPPGDYNGENQFVTSRTQLIMKNGLLESSGSAFLTPILKERPNIKLKIKVFTTKIVIDRNKRASGVHFVQKGVLYFAKALNEVIVSAGSINTPKILMLSGIGPSNTLRKLKIPVILNHPNVGQNYRESIMFPLTVSHNLTLPRFNFNENLRLLVKGLGEFTHTKTAALTFINLFPFKNFDQPDFALKFAMESPLDDIQVSSYLENSNEILTNLREEFRSLNNIAIWIEIFHTQSTGFITLKSKDPLDYPLINPKYLSNSSDIQDLVLAISFATQILETSSFMDIDADLVNDKNILACSRLSGVNKLICIIKHIATGSSEGIGTCRMGKNLGDSVVNEKLLVHGVSKLRVVDGSVIPTTISGKTSVVTAMIAEKIADEIKRLYKTKKS